MKKKLALTDKFNAHKYHRHRAFRKSANNVLLLLTWTSIIHDRSLKVITDWASSSNALSLHQQLLNDFQNCQKSKQLVLILAVLLCHERLLSYNSKNILQSMNDCYLVDINVLLNDKFLSNQRAIIEKMCYAFLKILYIFFENYKNMSELFFDAMNTDEISLLNLFDDLTNQYLTKRIKNEHSHLIAYTKVKILCSAIKMMLKLNDDVSSVQANINSISKNYHIVIDVLKKQ